MQRGLVILCVLLALAVIGLGITLGIMIPKKLDEDQVKKDLIKISIANSAAESPNVSPAQAKKDAECMADQVMKNGIQKAVGSIVIGCLRQQKQTPISAATRPNGPANPVPPDASASVMTDELYQMCSKYYKTNAEVELALKDCGIKTSAQL